MRKFKEEDLYKLFLRLFNKVNDKFNTQLPFEEREARMLGYRQAIKDIAAELEIKI